MPGVSPAFASQGALLLVARGARLLVSGRRGLSSASMTLRRVKKVVIAQEKMEGRGARVHRSIGNGVSVDPFLMLDEFNVGKPAGFPHTVTYMLKGSFRHEDNKGHDGTIGVGDLQWMNAGRGIVHSEMPGPDYENVGLQLWVNLAAADKMSEPEYQELLAADVPTATSPDGKTKVKVIAGSCFGVDSPVFTKTPTMYLDIGMESGAGLESLAIPEDYNAFAYVLEGGVRIASHAEESSHGACVVLSEGSGVALKAGAEGARLVVIAGRPIGEPVVQHGPFAMNTRQEIQQAFADYQNGNF